jgi:hypothetical protein
MKNDYHANWLLFLLSSWLFFLLLLVVDVFCPPFDLPGADSDTGIQCG